MSIQNVSPMKKLGLLLEQARIEAGISYEHLAAKLHCPTLKELYFFEDRIGALPSEVLFQVVTVLKVDPLEVMDILSPMEFPANEPGPDLPEKSQAPTFTPHASEAFTHHES